MGARQGVGRGRGTCIHLNGLPSFLGEFETQGSRPTEFQKYIWWGRERETGAEKARNAAMRSPRSLPRISTLRV